MPDQRRHIITGEPILFAPERAGRPNAFGDEGIAVCPFCPAHESMTPPEIERVGEPWRIRVFPNKYPSVPGHEIIVESPDHHATFDKLPNAWEAIETYVRRYTTHGGAALVSLFTNHGRSAGASIDHLHSQLMPLPFIPPRAAREIEAFARAASCPLCDAIEHHRRAGLVIDESDGFVRLVPHGSSHAYEQWVLPLAHQPEFTSVAAGAFANALQRATAAAARVSRAHNVIHMNFRGAPAAHFYAMVVPRLSALAGFELGTGTFIDIIDPAAAVRVLR